MSESIYLLTISLFLGTVLFVFGLKYVSAAYQARVRGATDLAYRELAQAAIAGQSEIARTLAALQAELSQISGRVDAVAKILKDVE